MCEGILYRECPYFLVFLLGYYAGASLLLDLLAGEPVDRL
jgi:hypothetical protein